MTKRTYVLSEQTKTIMAVVNKCGADGIKAKEVAERLQLDPLMVSQTLANLLKSKHIFAHTKGVRYYKAMKYKPVIKASEVERHIPTGSFHGVDWSHSTQRPGCQDHLQIPSRVGDRIVPYKAPGLICTGVLADKSNHTKD